MDVFLNKVGEATISKDGKTMMYGYKNLSKQKPVQKSGQRLETRLASGSPKSPQLETPENITMDRSSTLGGGIKESQTSSRRTESAKSSGGKKRTREPESNLKRIKEEPADEPRVEIIDLDHTDDSSSDSQEANRNFENTPRRRIKNIKLETPSPCRAK